MKTQSTGLAIATLLLLTSVWTLGENEEKTETHKKVSEWTVKDLPFDSRSGKVEPVSNEVILKNSYELLKKRPDDKELRRQTRELAKALVQPREPSPLAWQILIEEGLIKDGMPLATARLILGKPTYEKDGKVIWYFNHQGFHVHPGLQATVDGTTLKDWALFEG